MVWLRVDPQPLCFMLRRRLANACGDGSHSMEESFLLGSLLQLIEMICLCTFHNGNNENASISSVVTLIELPRLAASSAQGNPEPGRLRKSVDPVRVPSRLSS